MEQVIVFNNIRVLSVPDIAAMKLNAIANRGSKKDFYDLYFLLRQFKIEDLIKLFKKKFKTQDVFGLLRSITYFGDADIQNDVTLLMEKQLTWKQVKKTIIEETKKFL